MRKFSRFLFWIIFIGALVWALHEFAYSLRGEYAIPLSGVERTYKYGPENNWRYDTESTCVYTERKSSRIYLYKTASSEELCPAQIRVKSVVHNR